MTKWQLHMLTCSSMKQNYAVHVGIGLQPEMCCCEKQQT